MAVWLIKIELADVFHNDDMTFTERRDAIVGRIKESGWYSEDYDDLWWAVDELADATNEDEFNAVWSGIYDLADADRVWIGTF